MELSGQPQPLYHQGKVSSILDEQRAGLTPEPEVVEEIFKKILHPVFKARASVFSANL